MSSPGIRDLQRRVRELLRRDRTGEATETTERLRASGDLSPANGTIDDLPEPLALDIGHDSPSAVLERLRRHER